MSIIWKYLDKRNGTIEAIKDYPSMKFIIAHTDEEIRDAYDRMASVGSPKLDGMPRTHNPQACEDRIIKGISDIDILKERYRQAKEYVEWFEPAWNELSDDERYVLEAFYVDDGDQTGSIYDICDHFNIERSSAYNKKNRAVQHLSILLFGKA